jgi:hypothetical protein
MVLPFMEHTRWREEGARTSHMTVHIWRAQRETQKEKERQWKEEGGEGALRNRERPSFSLRELKGT